MRGMLMAVVVAATGCSLGMRQVDPQWSGRGEPQCDDSYGYVVGDAAVSVVGLIAVLIAANQKNPSTGSDIAAIGGGAAVIAFGIDSLFAEKNADRCGEAKTSWRVASANR